MVRKVADDEYVEGYCTNHPMKNMGDFQAWYLGSQRSHFLNRQSCCFSPSWIIIPNNNSRWHFVAKYLWFILHIFKIYQEYIENNSLFKRKVLNTFFLFHLSPLFRSKKKHSYSYGCLENRHFKRIHSLNSNRTSPSLLTVSLYRCAMSPRLSSISGSSGVWPTPKGSEDRPPVGHHKWFDSWGTKAPVLQLIWSYISNAIEILDVIGLSVITFRRGWLQ